MIYNVIVMWKEIWTQKLTPNAYFMCICTNIILLVVALYILEGLILSIGLRSLISGAIVGIGNIVFLLLHYFWKTAQNKNR